MIGERFDSPAELVEPDDGEVNFRRATFVHPTEAAVVLGSAQRPTDVDVAACKAAGFQIVRRRSGGGVVVVEPEAQIWLEAFLPADDPLYDSDVSRSAWWLGELWAASLAETLGVDASLRVHRDALQRSRWSRQVCFLGLGPGEVLRGERKVVGISQRRDRNGATFFSMAHAHLSPGRDARLIAPPGATEVERGQLGTELQRAVEVLGTAAAAVEQALRRHLESDSGAEGWP